MKYGITFYKNDPMPVLTKEESILGAWYDSVELYTLEEAYSILKGSGYEFRGVDEDGWHEFAHGGSLSAVLVPESDIE
jgi:hypothetical protein